MEMTLENLDDFPVVALRQELKRRGLPVGGLKAPIVARLREHWYDEIPSSSSVDHETESIASQVFSSPARNTRARTPTRKAAETTPARGRGRSTSRGRAAPASAGRAKAAAPSPVRKSPSPARKSPAPKSPVPIEQYDAAVESSRSSPASPVSSIFSEVTVASATKEEQSPLRTPASASTVSIVQLSSSKKSVSGTPLATALSSPAEVLAAVEAIAASPVAALSPQKQHLSALRKQLAENRSSIVLHKRPITTLVLALEELVIALKRAVSFIARHIQPFSAVFVAFLAVLYLHFNEGPHTDKLKHYEAVSWNTIYWIGLGIASSVGFGTGLHTFVLYLGPHIARVTLAVSASDPTKKLADILPLVQLDALLWGLGTAIGELPPYFFARAARLSNKRLEESGEGEEEEQDTGLIARLSEKCKPLIDRFIAGRYAFFFILAMASIPNPLFDLAGVTCGYSLVPFWTFFGATMIGKAVFKAGIQSVFIISLFHEASLQRLIAGVESVTQFIGQYIPSVADSSSKILAVFQAEKAKFGKLAEVADGEGQVESTESWIAVIWGHCISLLIAGFVISIINSVAQARQLDQDEQVIAEEKKKFEAADEQLSRPLFD